MSFGHLHTSWNVYVKLRKDGFQQRRDEGEALDFLQRMASTQRIDINVVVRNAMLSWQSHFRAEQAQLSRPFVQRTPLMTLPSPVEQDIFTFNYLYF